GLKFDYRDSPLKIINNGHTVQVNMASGSHMQVGDHIYQLLQFHFHSPSENTWRGSPFAMEVHLVHEDDQGRLAVVGVFMERGRENPFIQTLWNNLPAGVGHEKTGGHVLVNAGELLPANGSYYHFTGSLTTPPCTEGVRWFVIKSPIQASAAQVERFVALIGHNARPTRPLNGRSVTEVAAGRIAFGPIAVPGGEAASLNAGASESLHTGAPAPRGGHVGAGPGAIETGHGPGPASSHGVAPGASPRGALTRAPKADHGAGSENRPASGRREAARPAGTHAEASSTWDENAMMLWIYLIGALLILGISAAFILKKELNMNILNRMKIGVKIALIVGTLSALLVVVAGFSIIKMDNIGEELRSIAEEDIPMVELLTRITVHQLEMAVMMERGVSHGVQGDHAGLRRVAEEMETLGKKVVEEIGNARERAQKVVRESDAAVDRQEFEEILKQLEIIFNEHEDYKTHVFQLFDMLFAGNLQEAKTFAEKVESEADQVDHGVEALLTEFETFTENAALRAEHDEQRAVKVLLILSVFAVFIGVLVGVVVTRGVTRPLNQAVLLNNRLAEGDLAVDIDVDRTDEIGQLMGAMKTMASNLNDTVQVAEQIARGDLGVEVKLLSDKDTLGKSLTAMVSNLKDTVRIAERIAEGDLEVRVKLLSDKDALGKSLTAMVSNLKDTVLVAEQIAQGDLSVEVTLLSDKDALGKSLTAMVSNLKDTVRVAERIAEGD
ncbi:MAG: HAMP domain-containing protein, partial [Desulfobacterales bacterium]|nr:HAMP domain-containing protein [Desulfobacterales bacterium]